MMPQNHEAVRVILRGRAAGGITQADVQRRARELSLIRTGSEDYTTEDLAAAERELMIGHDPATTTDDAHSALSASRDPSDPIADGGDMLEPTETADENTTPEKLVVQGVEEAQHDQMVAAQKPRRKMRARENLGNRPSKPPQKRRRKHD